MFTFVLQLVYIGWLTATKLTAKDDNRNTAKVTELSRAKQVPCFGITEAVHRLKGKRGVGQKPIPLVSLLTHTTRRKMAFQKVVRDAVVVQL